MGKNKSQIRMIMPPKEEQVSRSLHKPLFQTKNDNSVLNNYTLKTMEIVNP